jgi:diazepam-binding inhibitor (GABA receptor modulating acyl-CoA-binding protein)
MVDEVDVNEFETYAAYCKEGGIHRPLVDDQSTDIRLKLYSLGKQGEFGDNKDPKPGMFAIIEKKKWEAWEGVKGLDQTVAKKEFIKLAKQIIASAKKK